MKTEFLSNHTVPCSFFKQQYQTKKGITIKVGGEDVVLDTTAKMKKYLDCYSDQEAVNYVYEKLFHTN